jgi:lipopolysaccharide transport system ATP-binding protein
MSRTRIQAEGLSKLYRIGAANQRHDTLRDHLVATFKRLAHSNGTRANHNDTSFWALKDVSFEVKEGEVWGIVGRNGAGKSTLLKILSRITAPTRGHARIVGRVGSLLEVGTGFHPELTGRENVFLNGAVLGMKRAEIDRKFDEIVSFAEIEKFVDTPVKHYSSGMYLRLAFAVAAHLESEVLIVDEVLAVGDSTFQKKCLGKMHGVAREGRTVLFVSHNMAAVENLCRNVLILDAGKVAFSGGTHEAINFFLNRLQGPSQGAQSHIIDLENASRLPRFGPVLTAIELYGEAGSPLKDATLKLGGPLKLCVCFRPEHSVANLVVTITILNMLGQCVLEMTSTPQPARAGLQSLMCEIPSLTLLPNKYTIEVYLDINNINVDRVTDAVSLTVVASDYYGNGRLPKFGFVAMKHVWYGAQADAEEKEAAAQLS